MSDDRTDLGRLISVHPVAPAYVQRAVFISVLSFLFFLAMMFAFYLRQSLGYFVLASAFLIIYIATLFGWLKRRRNIVKLYENGIIVNKQSLLWPQIRSCKRGSDGGLLLTNIAGEITRIPASVYGIETIEPFMETRVGSRHRTMLSTTNTPRL
jgi:hypothetical protein